MRYPNAVVAALVSLGLVAGLAPAASAASPGEIPKPPGTNPDDRGWEKVTPADKGGLDVGGISYRAHAKAAQAGSALAYAAQGVFAGSPIGAFPNYYLGRRTASGWGTTPLTPPGVASVFGTAAFSAQGRTSMVLHLDPELQRSVVESNAALAPGEHVGAYNLYARDTSGGAPAPLAPPGPTYVDSLMSVLTLAGDASPYFEAASSNGRHVVFGSLWQFTPDAPSDPGERLFLSSGGDVSLVSVLPDGTIANRAVVGSGMSTHNAISKDGSRVYFTEIVHLNTPTGDLYLRDGDETYALAPGIDQAAFMAARADGSKALYYDYANLRLYLYDADSHTSEEVSVDAEPADGGEPRVYGVLAASDDLERVYFTASGMLVPGQPPVDPSDRAIYLWDRGTLSYVGTLTDSQDENLTGPADLPYTGYPATNPWPSRPYVNWTPDGTSVVFDTTAKVTDYEPNGFRQVYRYTAGSDGIVCLSCPDGPPTADAILVSETIGFLGTHARPLGQRNSISDDGRRVFFSTGQSLVRGDVNDRGDVYVWQDGAAHLISDGIDKHDARFVEASADGDDVFFATAAPLVAADQDELVDIYDARVGGGFPEPPRPAVADCAGDACQGPPAAGPSAKGGSGSLHGAGDVVSRPRAALSLRPLTTAQRASLAAGRGVSVRVAVPRAGRVSLVVRARTDGRSRRVASGHATARRAGKVLVRLRLSKPARGTLRRGGDLALTFHARLGSLRAGPVGLRLKPIESKRAAGR